MSRMNPYFAVFNLHVNNAGTRADTEFKEQFGDEIFKKEIEPYHTEGIMSIFNDEPNMYTMSWVTLVTAFTNENR